MSKLTGLGARLHTGETSIDFIGKRRRWYAFSGLLIIASILSLSLQGLHLGIEFKGGASFIVKKSGVSIEDARSVLSQSSIPGESIVQLVGTDKVRIQTGALTNAESSSLKTALAQKFSVDEQSIDTQIIGPSWGKEITRKAIYGLIGFIIVVLLYLAMAFEPKMALSAIIAVIHDVFITVGIYSIVGFDVTPATVIGFLTILGYSLYDTVVVFDKIRENTKSITATSKMTFTQAVNLGVNQTIIRSANTSIIALLPVASILFVGAGLLSLALFIGLAAGTYSSIFIAPPILATLREKEPAMAALAKRVNSRGSTTVTSAAALSGTAPTTSSDVKRGPRNQPKRKGRK